MQHCDMKAKREMCDMERLREPRFHSAGGPEERPLWNHKAHLQTRVGCWNFPPLLKVQSVDW